MSTTHSETASERRQRGGEIGLGGREFIAAGDLDITAGDGALQARAGAFADFGGFGEDETFLERLVDDGFGERMLGVAFQAGS